MNLIATIRNYVDVTALRLLFSFISICSAGSLVNANGFLLDSPAIPPKGYLNAVGHDDECSASNSIGFCRSADKSKLDPKSEFETFDLQKTLDQYTHVSSEHGLACRADDASRS